MASWHGPGSPVMPPADTPQSLWAAQWGFCWPPGSGEGDCLCPLSQNMALYADVSGKQFPVTRGQDVGRYQVRDAAVAV